MTPITTAGFRLHSWQHGAVQAWAAGSDGTPFRGTLEVVTGGGKTMIALECLALAAAQKPDLRLAVIVPTEALARQWRHVILRHTNLREPDVGLLGAGGKDTFSDRRALVCVLNSAAERLPQIARSGQPLMLIVDECHRAGAPRFSKVLDTPAEYRLGLSATPDREEFDDDGEPLSYDEQAVGQSLGGVVYRFDLRDARLAGWLPDYTLHHHGVSLTDQERMRYDSLSRRVDEVAKELTALGGGTSRARQIAAKDGDAAQAARRWVALTAKRKDLLFRAAQRADVAARLVTDAFSGPGLDGRAILFHERVDEASALFIRLHDELPNVRIELEHSRLPESRREGALSRFRSGAAQVLVSVKSLVEGIDVPEADLGISVAATSSVRQRVQALGRVLRRTTSSSRKRSVMHLIYVRDTVDELIYGKADWTDLTGADRNRFWLWNLDGEPLPADGPPLSPRPTEDQMWQSLGEQLPAELPAEWPGVIVGQEYSVDTMGNVRNGSGKAIANPQGVAGMVESVRGRPGGRFRVTPSHHLVLVSTADHDNPGYRLAGQLAEPFTVRDETASAKRANGATKPGDPYAGSSDKKRGTFKISARGGGMIERRTRTGKEFALVEGSGNPAREADTVRVIDAWRSLGLPGLNFHVNSAGDAWYEASGERRFLAAIQAGFLFPEDLESES